MWLWTGSKIDKVYLFDRVLPYDRVVLCQIIKNQPVFAEWQKITNNLSKRNDTSKIRYVLMKIHGVFKKEIFSKSSKHRCNSGDFYQKMGFILYIIT